MILSMKKTIAKFRNLGIAPDLTADELTKIQMVNTIFLLSIAFCLILGTLTITLGHYVFATFLLVSLIAVIVEMYWMSKRFYQRVYNFLLVGFTIFCFSTNLFLGNSSGSRFIFLMLVYLVYVIYESNQTRLIVVGSLIVLYFLTTYLYSIIPVNYHLDIPNGLYFKELLFVFYVIGIGYLINHYHDDVVRQKVKQQNLIQELQEKNQRIKAVSAELERFNHIASHDLKSPLRNIISFLGLAKYKLKKENYAALAEKMTYVNTATGQMDTLVNDVISYSKISHEPIEATLIDLSVVIGEAYQKVKLLFKNQDITLQLDDLPNIRANQKELVIAFYHLIKNGFQYNLSPKRTIYISSWSTKEWIEIHIKDNGIGIEKIYETQIFEYFKRLHTYEAYQGSGLGLGITKKIINKYNGKIEVKSEKGVGSTFILFFKKA